MGGTSGAPELCSAAAAALAQVGGLADCTLVAEDGSTTYKVSKAVVALHSSVLGCASKMPCCTERVHHLVRAALCVHVLLCCPADRLRL